MRQTRSDLWRPSLAQVSRITGSSPQSQPGRSYPQSLANSGQQPETHVLSFPSSPAPLLRVPAWPPGGTHAIPALSGALILTASCSQMQTKEARGRGLVKPFGDQPPIHVLHREDGFHISTQPRAAQAHPPIPPQQQGNLNSRITPAGQPAPSRPLSRRG